MDVDSEGTGGLLGVGLFKMVWNSRSFDVARLSQNITTSTIYQASNALQEYGEDFGAEYLWLAT